jgi:hypothetical protein
MRQTMMVKVFIYLLLIVTSSTISAQGKTENLVVITLDGMRWQEVFGGIDSVLVNDSTFNHDREGIKQKFGAGSAEERREKLFPFLWTVIANQGQIYGNRKYDNRFDNANRYWVSYPGYNEIFTGYPDTLVNSNDKVYNKNENVLEFLNKQKGFEGKVAVFSTWNCFPYILNEPRSKILVNADIDTLDFDSPALRLLNDIQLITNKPSGVRPDVLTYFAAREYLKAYKPRVLYIAFDETDHFAHAGMYDQYIGSAHSQDAMIRDMWTLLQSLPEYKDKTSLLITVDHGRGDSIKSNWKSHGRKIPDAHQLWLAAIGPGIKKMGEVKTGMQLYQAQLATTLAALLSFNFKPAHPVYGMIESLAK